MCHIVHSEVGRDKPHDDGGSARHVVELTQTFRRQLTARKIGRLHIAASHTAEPSKRGTRFFSRIACGLFPCRRFHVDTLRWQNLFALFIPKQSEHICSSLAATFILL